MITLLLLLGGLAIAGIVGSLVSIARDGYRRRPDCVERVRRA